MNKNLTISLDKAKILYASGGEDIKKLLLSTFTKEELVSFIPAEWNNYVKVNMDGNTFFISKYLVTQKDWVSIMGTNPSIFIGYNRPVENVSCKDVISFINKLNVFIGKKHYRLPTEEEWQYCAECGSGIEYTANKENAIFNFNSHETADVGQKKPNEWGLYDMVGNVWELTDTWYADRRSYIVLRGGSWGSYAGSCRSAIRRSYSPDSQDHSVGFRLIKQY